MAQATFTFQDGTKATLKVSAPWWSWIWLGILWQPARGTVTTTIKQKKKVKQWWCIWFCSKTEAVEVEKKVSSIKIEAKGTNNNQVADQGSSQCTNCSEESHSVHLFGFPVPPWLGGAAFQGIGFRATVSHAGKMAILHDHWGKSGGLPADFQ